MIMIHKQFVADDLAQRAARRGQYNCRGERAKKTNAHEAASRHHDHAANAQGSLDAIADDRDIEAAPMILARPHERLVDTEKLLQ